MKEERIKVLCVDDEPNVLEGLELHLRRKYAVVTATSGSAALAALEQNGVTGVIVSDMRMPGMDGATFLAKARAMRPDAVRILLTGHAEMQSAIAAVNDGQIFRFLTKPCPPAALLASIDAAAEQHRLVTAERVLLKQTLRGSIQVLADVLALTNPVSFGCATRIKQLAVELACALKAKDAWQVEVAAMLSQIGGITLPQETAEKVYFGLELTPAEEQMIAKLPAITEQLLAHLPRLDVVRGILAAYPRPMRRDHGATEAEKDIQRFAQILKIAIDFDALEARGYTPALAVDAMRGKTGTYDPVVLEALSALRHGDESNKATVREIRIANVHVGMVFAEDVFMAHGPLLVARGYEVTSGFVARAELRARRGQGAGPRDPARADPSVARALRARSTRLRCDTSSRCSRSPRCSRWSRRTEPRAHRSRSRRSDRDGSRRRSSSAPGSSVRRGPRLRFPS
jgi:response regulator RpfG family c-di-GMP phosphodiesterase